MDSDDFGVGNEGHIRDRPRVCEGTFLQSAECVREGLRRDRNLFTAVPGEELVTFVVRSDDRHKLFILK